VKPNVHVQDISLNCPRIEDAKKVAVFLARALPNLQHIVIDCGAKIKVYWREFMNLEEQE
jgi:hypothetical protein